MKAQDLKNTILQLAIQGKLVEQNLNDEPASLLLEKIKAEKEQLIKEKKIKREKPLPKISEEEKIFEIPESWQWVRLGDLGIAQTGTTPSTTNSEYFGNDIPFIKPADITFNSINYFNEGLTELGLSKGRLIKANSILMVCIGGSTGKCYFNDRDVTCNQQINTITPILIENKYLLHVLQSDYFYKILMAKATGTATPIVNKTSWSTICIPLPPVEEQKRIVAKIEEILEKIEEYDKVEKELTQLEKAFPQDMKKSILQYAIQGKLVEQNPNDEPASVLLEKIKAEKEQLIKENKIKKEKPLPEISEEEKYFEIPDSWEWVRLGSILQKLTDGTHSTPRYVNKGIPFLSVKDMSSGVLDFSNTKYVSKEEHEELFKRCNPEYGDVLLTKVGTTGVPVIVDTEKEFSLFVSVALLKFNKEFIYNRFLYYLLQSPLLKKQCEESTKGVGNKNLVIRDISKMILPLPPLEEQKCIVDKIDNVMIYIDKLQDKINNKNELRKMVQAKSIEVEGSKELINN